MLEMCIEDIVHQAVAQNRQLLAQNNVKVEVENSDVTAYTDCEKVIPIDAKNCYIPCNLI